MNFHDYWTFYLTFLRIKNKSYSFNLFQKRITPHPGIAGGDTRLMFDWFLAFLVRASTRKESQCQSQSQSQSQIQSQRCSSSSSSIWPKTKVDSASCDKNKILSPSEGKLGYTALQDWKTFTNRCGFFFLFSRLRKGYWYFHLEMIRREDFSIKWNVHAGLFDRWFLLRILRGTGSVWPFDFLFLFLASWKMKFL